MPHQCLGVDGVEGIDISLDHLRLKAAFDYSHRVRPHRLHCIATLRSLSDLDQVIERSYNRLTRSLLLAAYTLQNRLVDWPYRLSLSLTALYTQ
jgi:hypothetical protein